MPLRSAERPLWPLLFGFGQGLSLSFSLVVLKIDILCFLNFKVLTYWRSIRDFLLSFFWFLITSYSRTSCLSCLCFYSYFVLRIKIRTRLGSARAKVVFYSYFVLRIQIRRMPEQRVRANNYRVMVLPYYVCNLI